MIRAPFLTQLGPNDVLIGSYQFYQLEARCRCSLDSLCSRPMPLAAPNYVRHFSHCRRRAGRGAPSNVNEGNRRFRELVLSRKDEYVAATKRQVKNQIAREIVHTITNVRRGNFVRRVESLVEAEDLGIPEGMNAWAFVSLEIAVQKTKQALRDQAVAAAKGVELAASSTYESTTTTTTTGTTTAASAMDAYKSQKVEQPGDTGLIGDYLRLAREVRIPTSSIPGHLPPYQLDSLRADVVMGHQQQQQQQMMMMSHMLPSTLPLSSPMTAVPHDFRPSSAFNPSPYSFHGSFSPNRPPTHEEVSAASAFRQPMYRSHPSAQPQMAQPLAAFSIPPRTMRGSTTAPARGTLSTFQRTLASDVDPWGESVTRPPATTALLRSGKFAKAAKSGVKSSGGGARTASSRQPPTASEKSQSPSPAPSSASSSSSPSPTSSSVVVRDESTGEAALRVAVEIATGVRPKHPKQEFLELTLLEMHMLSVACALGIPSFPSSGTPSSPMHQHDEDASLTWAQVAAAIEFVANRWSEDPPSPLSPTSQARFSGIAASDDRTPQGQDPPRRKDTARYAALRQAQKLKTKPKELIKTIVLLLGRVRSFGMSSGVSDRPLPLEPANYELWFLDELRRYVPTLDHVVASQLETKRPAIALRSAEMTGLMDREDCRAVYAQVSCISRLRALFERASAQGSSKGAATAESSWQAQVVAAASLCDKNKVWSSRPGWWVTSVTSSSDEDDHGEGGAAAGGSAHSGDDVALLDMVLREAVFASEQGSPLLLAAKESKGRKDDSEARLSASASLQRLGMSKAAVQERVSQLVEQLHRQYQQER